MSRAKGKKKKPNIIENIMGWPDGTVIPDKLSDWLAFLVYKRLIEYADEHLESGDILLISYNLGGWQIHRGIPALFSTYLQYIILQKVGEKGNGSMNVWTDGKFTAMIRNGNAYGKRIFTKVYDRNRYLTSRILATVDEDIEEGMALFPNAPNRYYMIYDNDKYY